MQRAKDTFYIAVRDRIASLNPARTVLLRGVMRPGVLVEENELAVESWPNDAFRLRWTELSIDVDDEMPLAALRCEIIYATSGNTGNGGMDRGRLLAAMDAELAMALNQSPQNAIKQDYTAASGPASLKTKIFWGEATFGPLTLTGEQLSRTATVDVFSYQEAGEL
jgi:hypothetical protein